MPRRPRITLPGVALHLIQRGNNGQACFFADEQYAQESSCAIHTYVLMTNHVVHPLMTPRTSSGASELMKRLGQRYVQYVNRTYRRSGTLWEGRFRSCSTREQDYVLGCYRYIEPNPVRAYMVRHPAEYPWSSELFRYQLDPGMTDEIRTATNDNYALGSSQFQAQVAAVLGRRVTPGKSGRPLKRKVPESLNLFDGS